MAGFEFFGAVPIRISYDNTSIAVSKIIGNEPELTRGFLTLESHHLFDHHFCHVGRGNEKGHVENHVGYSRRNLLVPVPSFPSWAALNEYLAAACYADLFRRVRGKVGTKAERLEDDRAAMLALPAETFEPRRVAQGHANSLFLVRFDRNDYSVPTAYAHHEVTVLGGIDDVAPPAGPTSSPVTPGTGAKSTPRSIRSTTWPSSNASPAPSTSPGRSSTGDSPNALPPCAAGSKQISATREPPSSSRCCAS